MTTYEIYLGTRLVREAHSVAELLQAFADLLTDDYDLDDLHIVQTEEGNAIDITPEIRTWLL